MANFRSLCLFKMITNDPKVTYWLVKCIADLTCNVCCATNISSLRIFIADFSELDLSIENGKWFQFSGTSGKPAFMIEQARRDDDVKSSLLGME